jgi:Ca-activated chloride channel family protein
VLHVTIKPHREYLRANAGAQKLFVMLKLLPTPEAAQARPRVHLALVIDTSGSMREPAPGSAAEILPAEPFTVDGKTYNATFEGTTKLDIAMDAARRLVGSANLQPDDSVSIIQFDDNATIVAEGQIGPDHERLLAGIDALGRYSGGTQMGKGLNIAVEALGRADQAARKVLLLTDGRAVDELDCRDAAGALAQLHTPIIALGVGEEYNEDLLSDLCSVSQGRPYDFRDMTALPDIFEAELGAATRQVIADVRLTVRTVRDAQLASAMRAYPNLADIDPAQEPLPLGNVEAGDHTVFILEFDLQSRPPVRARLAQLGVTYLVTAQGYRGEVAPQDVVVEFTEDEALAAAVDSEVMGYVQQRNVDNLVRQATEQAKTNPEQAARTLQVARSMTQRLGNAGMTQALGQAVDELRGNGTIKIGTVKTIKLGARTQTMKAGGPDAVPDNIPSDEEIRKITGA